MNHIRHKTVLTLGEHSFPRYFGPMLFIKIFCFVLFYLILFCFFVAKLNQQVFATTCLGVDDLVLRDIEFDYCIIDEASQINLPICLGPLFCAKTFVLVGDHYQVFSFFISNYRIGKRINLFFLASSHC